MAEALGLMRGKRGLIFGVANNRSLAWGIATALHAAVNLHDTWLAFVSAGYGVSCAAVIALTAYKRLSHRRRQDRETTVV